MTANRKLALIALAFAAIIVWAVVLTLALDLIHEMSQPSTADLPLPPTATLSPPPTQIIQPQFGPHITPTYTRVLPTPHPEPPTLEDFWNGQAKFFLEVKDTGLPMGESDTLTMPNGEMWSYVHASARSAGAIDQCGHPVDFPGCVVVYRSVDGGMTFHHDEPPVCLFSCETCPCTSDIDHIDQQQYPRVVRAGDIFVMAYEYRAFIFVRRSADGLMWSAPAQVPYTGIWHTQTRECAPATAIGAHPHLNRDYDCLAGGPPGLVVDGRYMYIFAGFGQSPGYLGCFYGKIAAPIEQMRPCRRSPLLTGAADYGPLDATGPTTNPYFDFRMSSAAEILRVDDRYYMLYEGIRGPGPGDPGDTQFGLGMARSLTGQIDDRWEKYPHNPILVDLPGNIGLGHADLVVIDGDTLLYTSLDGKTRSRLRLVWK
jgi:hypothetical protein